MRERGSGVSICALRQWFGYLLTAETSRHKILMLLGLPRSGKGTILRVLGGLLGPANVGSVRLEDLGFRFGPWPLRHKSVGVVSDQRLGDRADLSAVVGRLLSVSGEDDQSLEQKYHAPFTARLPTRFVIVSNEVPRLVDASAALASRLVVIRTARTFLGQENIKLPGELLAELPGILRWALGGLTDLNELGRFTQPSSGEEDIRSVRDSASPVGAFLRDCCALEPHAECGTVELYEAHLRWRVSAGYKQTVTHEQFGRDLRASAAVDTRQSRVGGGGARTRHYVGVKLLES